MPEELAGRATLLLIGGILAAAALGPLVNWLWQRMLRRPGGGFAGTAAGLALFGAAMAWVASDMAAVVSARSHYLSVQGRLLGFFSVKLRDTHGGYRLHGNDPVVEFAMPDGSTHQVRGMAGSLQQREPGSPVPVRVDPADPQQAVVADFQNQYAALWLFGSMAVLALAGALYCLLSIGQPGGPPPLPDGRNARSRGRAQAMHHSAGAVRTGAGAARGRSAAAASPSVSGFERWRQADAGQRWRRLVGRVALGIGVVALLSIFVLAEWLPIGRAIAGAFIGVTAALAVGAVSAVMAPGAPVGLTLFGRAIAVGAAGSFATLVWQLTGY